jgi:hypothetical protein
MLTINRPWFAIKQFLPYNCKQDAAIVSMNNRNLRENITKYHCPSVFPLVDDLEHNELSLISLPFNPIWA